MSIASIDLPNMAESGIMGSTDPELDQLRLRAITPGQRITYLDSYEQAIQ